MQGRSWPGGSRGPDPPARPEATYEIRANPMRNVLEKIGGVADVWMPLNEVSKYKDSVAECRST